MTREEFAAVVGYVGAAVQKPLSRDAIEVYYDLLGHYNQSELTAAAKVILRTHKYSSFPLVSQFVEQITQFRSGALSPLTPGEAWEIAWHAFGRIDLEVDGSIEQATKNIPSTIVDAMNAMGISAVVGGNEPVSVLRGQFFKVYEGIQAREARRMAIPAKEVEIIKRIASEQPKIAKSIADNWGFNNG